MITTISTLVAQFTAGVSFNPVKTHARLIGVCVLGSIAVGFGILLESWAPKSCKAKIVMGLVIGGVVVEALFTILLFVFDEGISSAQQSKIINLEEPRDVNIKVFVSLLTNAPKSLFLIQYTGGGDTEWLADRLFAAFEMLQWQPSIWPTRDWPPVERPGPVTLENTELCRLVPNVTCIGAQTMGVTVLVHESPSKADESMRSQVMDAFTKAEIGWISGVYGGSAASVPPRTIWIIVAPSP